MTKPNTVEKVPVQEPKLPRRDWILLPGIAFLTMLVLIVSTESVARAKFRDSETGLAPCLVLNDPSTGVRGVPNSDCWDKDSETAWTEYKFNSCGHRAGMECGHKTPGTYRIVMTGSSIAMGLYVERAHTIAGLLPGDLTHLTGRDIEVYNASIGAAYGGTPHSIALRFNEIVAAKPDMILWVLSPWDIEHATDLEVQDQYLRAAGIDKSEGAVTTSPRGSILRRAERAVHLTAASHLVYDQMKGLRFRTLLSHYLFESQSLYVQSYLKNKDDDAGFLKADWGPAWQQQLSDFNTWASVIEGRARSEGIPIAVVLVPNRAQAAMISMGRWPTGYDPYRVDSELKTVVTSHGGSYVDILPAFRGIPDPEKYYLPVDGHPDAQGHAMIADLLSRALTNGSVPALTPVRQLQASLEKTK